MLLDRNDPSRSGDREHAAAVIAAGLAEAEPLGLAREVVRLQRLRERLAGASDG